VIPAHWKEVSLGSLGDWFGGGTPSKQNPAFWTNGTIPWVSPKDVKVFRIAGAHDSITADAVQGSATKLVPAGSVLIVVRSGILEHTLPIAVASVPVTLNQDMKAITPISEVVPDFLAYYLVSAGSRILRECSKAGTTVASVEFSALKLHATPLPLLHEQHRIVAAIETHFSRLDAAVASLTRAKANVKRARASVLKAAVEGRLVPTEAALARAEGRDYEPAAVLLDRILAEREAAWAASGARGKYKEPVKPETEGLPGLPEGWCWASVDELAQVVGGIAKDGKQTDGRLVPYLRVANVQRGRLELGEVKTILAPEAKIHALRLQPGDVLLNEGGDRDKLGRGWIWRGEIPECIHQNHVFRARLWSADFDSRYLSHYANTEGDRYFLKEGKQTTNLASISLSKVKALPVALPPKAEIDRILAEVDRRLSVLDALDATLDANLARCARLRQAILKRAFEGRLVPAEPPADPPPRAAAPQLPLFAERGAP
jgi:type I restriction enzyme S subunit